MDGVDHDRLPGPGPLLDQVDRLARVLDDAQGGEARVAQAPRDHEPRRVVAAPLVSDADHERGQARSTSSFRKWVAQEMQGS